MCGNVWFSRYFRKHQKQLTQTVNYDIALLMLSNTLSRASYFPDPSESTFTQDFSIDIVYVYSLNGKQEEWSFELLDKFIAGST